MLEYEDSGTGEPVICIHGAFIADTFRPLQFERSMVDRYRLISYHRRGYVGSGPIGGTASLADEVHDCCALLAHLGVRLAHVIGHSFGGVVALQLALKVPQLVHTLTLLEAALVVGDSGPLYRQGLQQSVQRYREAGARVVADEFLQMRWPYREPLEKALPGAFEQAVADEFLQMRWPGYREPLEKALPGAFEQAVADAPASFAADVPAALNSRFGEEQAVKITQPVLVVLGERSVALHPRFAETYQLLLDWLPNAEGFVLPRATHFLHLENPRDMAGALTDFYARHPLGEAAT
jgi:pimeloyl-ACP methyl ester carboxylesterase